VSANRAGPLSPSFDGPRHNTDEPNRFSGNTTLKDTQMDDQIPTSPVARTLALQGLHESDRARPAARALVCRLVATGDNRVRGGRSLGAATPSGRHTRHDGALLIGTPFGWGETCAPASPSTSESGQRRSAERGVHQRRGGRHRAVRRNGRANHSSPSSTTSASTHRRPEPERPPAGLGRRGPGPSASRRIEADANPVPFGRQVTSGRAQRRR